MNDRSDNLDKNEPQLPGELPQALPPELVDALRDLESGHLFVPLEVDDRVLSEARRCLAQARRRQSVWRRVLSGGGTAVAAAVLLGFGLLWLNSSDTAPLLAGDVDGNGQVDILDAMTLARRIEAGESTKPAWDFSADGRVDHADADALAMRLVQLGEPG